MRDDVFLPGRLAELCVPLKHVTKPVLAGITLGPHRVPKRHASGYLRVANVRKGWIDTSDIATLEEQKQDRPRYELARGDVLVVEGHADPGQIGRAAIVTDEHSGLLYQNHLYRLRFTGAVPEFAVLWLNSPYVRSYWMTRCATSSGLYTINSKLLEEVPFPDLDEAEQRSIVAAHAVVERRIAALERLRAKFRVTEASLAVEVFADMGSRWPTARLESIATVAAGVTLGSEPVGEGTVELPYLRVANVLDGRIDTADLKRVRILRSQYERFALRKGDLLLTEGGDLDKLGRGAVWDGRIDQCLHQNHVFRVRCGAERRCRRSSSRCTPRPMPAVPISSGSVSKRRTSPLSIPLRSSTCWSRYRRSLSRRNYSVRFVRFGLVLLRWIASCPSSALSNKGFWRIF
ncbi:hypothetical protein ACFXC9_20005 [Streptomyces naganishii]|uniref:restriction endonuclease subunit S n=1 Tax=Streptomyces naganishii TaxID=285447 RepID=UPI0036BF2287